MEQQQSPICMVEAFWKNSPLSVARHYGRCKFQGHEYWIVNKEGKDLFQLTHEANKRGNTMAITPGEPADMVRQDFLKFYRALGRDRFLDILKANQHASEKELTALYKAAIAEQKTQKP